MWALKALLAFLGLVVGYYVLVVNYGEYEKIYECIGEASSTGEHKSLETEAYLRFQDFRWFVFWMRGKGYVYVDVWPVVLFRHTKKWTDDIIHIVDDDDESIGSFNFLSNKVTFKVSDNYMFSGKCHLRT